MSKRKDFDKKIGQSLLGESGGPDKPKKESAPKAEERGPGRPKKNHNKKRYTIIIEPEYIAKVKIIAARKDCQISEVFSEAVKEYIGRYEKQNGPV